jgi:hypothetical protein
LPRLGQQLGAPFIIPPSQKTPRLHTCRLYQLRRNFERLFMAHDVEQA